MRNSANDVCPITNDIGPITNVKCTKKNDLKEKYDGRRNINCKKIKVYM